MRLSLFKKKRALSHLVNSDHYKVVIVYFTEEFAHKISNLLRESNFEVGLVKVKNSLRANLREVFRVAGYRHIVIFEVDLADFKKSLSLYALLKFGGVKVVASSLGNLSSRQRLVLGYLQNYSSLNSIADVIKREFTTLSDNDLFTLQFEEGFSEVEYKDTKLRVAYYTRWHKDNSKPLLVFFHGISARFYTYKMPMQKFSKHYSILGVDLPLHGLSSDTPEPTSLDTFSDIAYEAVKKILVKHKIPYKQVIFIGHSVGGAVALYSVAKLEKMGLKPKQLVLLNPVGIPFSESIMKLLLRGITARILFSKTYIKHRKVLQKVAREVVLFDVDKIVNGGGFGYFMKATSYMVVNGLKNISSYDIRTPTLLVYSYKDAFLKEKYVLEFSKLFRCLRLKEINEPHDWVVINEEKIEDIIKEMLGR